MPLLLRPEPLTVEGFAPFGRVISCDAAAGVSINDGHAQRFDALAAAEVGDGEAVLSIFRGTPWPTPTRICMLERHPRGSQAFVPMECHAWLVVVAERPEPSACRAFRARGDQGIQIATAVWHHPLLVLQPVHHFLVVDRRGPGDNLEEVHFAEDGALELAPA